MANNFIYLSPPQLEKKSKELVNLAIDSNWIAPIGPFLDKFEFSLEEYLNNKKKVIALNSGTSSINISLALLDIKREDVVLCQSFTFIATAAPAHHIGAKLIFIESESKTWNMCPIFLEEAICDSLKKGIKPKAIIAVHIYGMPFNVDEILQISKKYNIPLIEDAAEALGSRYKNIKCGSIGNFSILSFNGNKIITTSGGGALVVSNDELKKKAIFLSSQAKEDTPYYLHKEVGYNYRLSNICSAIGVSQLEVLQNRVLSKREIHQFYKNYFKDIDGICVFSEPNSNYFSNYWLTCILLDPQKIKCSVKKIQECLLNNNIESRYLWKPLHTQPVFKNQKYYGNGYSEYLFKNGLSLPSGTGLTRSNLLKIVDTISSCLN